MYDLSLIRVPPINRNTYYFDAFTQRPVLRFLRKIPTPAEFNVIFVREIFAGIPSKSRRKENGRSVATGSESYEKFSYRRVLHIVIPILLDAKHLNLLNLSCY